jgi:hypothetical protein
MENQENAEQQISQDGKLDIVAQRILADEGESQEEPEAKKEQPKGQDQPGNGGEQPSPEYEITEDEFKELTEELGYSEEDLDKFDRKNIDEILESKTKKPEEAKPETPETIITPEIAEKYGGIFKSFIGKTLQDVADAFRNNTTHINKLSTELKQYKEQTTKNEQQQIDELEKFLKNPPENLTEEDYFKKINELVDLKATIKIRASQPDPDEAKRTVEMYDYIQTQLPEGMKAEEVTKAWWNSLSPQEQASITKAGDYVLTTSKIKDYALLTQHSKEIEELKKQLAEKTDNVEKEAKVIAAKKAADALRAAKSKPVHGSNYKIVSPKAKPKYEGDIMIEKILEGLEN